jgi:PAS domain S-box-containing protein
MEDGMVVHPDFLKASTDTDDCNDPAAPSQQNDTGDDAVNLSDLMGNSSPAQINPMIPSAAKPIEDTTESSSTLTAKNGEPRTVPGPSAAVNPVNERPFKNLEQILLQALMDNLQHAIYFKDLKSRFIKVNTALADKHMGTTDTSRALGRTDFDFFAHEHARLAYEDEQKIITTGKPLIGFEEKETWPDGHETWVKTSKFPLKDAQGTIVGTWGVSEDITDHKRAEQELKSSEDLLRQSQKMEAFGQLAGGIAHDFNNMVSVILGAAQLVDMDLKESDVEIKRNINMVIDTSKRAADFTQQLLSFARKGKYTVVPIDTHEVIHSVVKLIMHTFDKKIRIVERLTARVVTVMGDFAQLQNALLNLALNSRDAMPDGGTLTFETATVGPAAEIDETQYGEITPGSFLRLRVTDTGCGMDEKTRARAFEPFFTTKGPGKGTGLGLTSVYGTVKNSGGIIEMDSTPGKGTRFAMFLPLVYKSLDSSSGKAATAGDKKAARILIVDDDEDLRLVFGEMLEHLGYEVFTCKDGVEAVEYYTIHHADIDAVILDLVMPRMGGHECINRLKKINPSACILISSGYNLVSDTQKIIARGIAGFIQKPYQTGEISKILYEALNR